MYAPIIDLRPKHVYSFDRFLLMNSFWVIKAGIRKPRQKHHNTLKNLESTTGFEGFMRILESD